MRPLLAELTGAHLIAEHLPRRYTFHDLLRAYATELGHAHEAADEQRAALCRTLDHYLHTADRAAYLTQPHRDPTDLSPALPGVTYSPAVPAPPSASPIASVSEVSGSLTAVGLSVTLDVSVNTETASY